MSEDIPKLNSELKTPQERAELVKKICELTPAEKLTPYYCEKMSDYILGAITREENNRTLTTTSRMKTINDRETSYQGLAEKLENGEDGLYNMFSDGGKGVYLTHQDKITEEDIRDIPELKILVDSINQLSSYLKSHKVYGKRFRDLNQQLIQMRQDQYIIRNSAKPRMYCTKLVKSFSKLDLGENITVTKDGEIFSDGIITLFNPMHISALLCNYSALKNSTYAKFGDDGYYLMMDLDNLIESTLKAEYPIYYRIFQCKVYGDSNAEIQKTIKDEFGITHSVEYISSLWRNKIPKLLADKAEEEYLVWYFTNKERGKWKKCNRCGEVKLAHSRFFSKNTSSKDGYYSICKKCRNKRSENKCQKELV